MAGRVFGELENVPLGTVFPNRASLAAASIHKPLQGGIAGGGPEGADSIVLLGGYEDDEDYGDEIGNDPQTGRQVRDQELKTGNPSPQSTRGPASSRRARHRPRFLLRASERLPLRRPLRC